MKLNWRRLLSRSSNPDETVTAYVEGRASPAEIERVRRMAAQSPEWARKVEELRKTVTLLRSVESSPAPRSFALRPEMAPEQRPALTYSRLAAIPAVAAAVLTLFVGVLVAGGLTGLLRQSEPGGQVTQVPEKAAETIIAENRMDVPADRTVDQEYSADAEAPGAAAPIPTPALAIEAIQSGSITESAPETAAHSEQGAAATPYQPSSKAHKPEERSETTPPGPTAGDDSGLAIPLWQLELLFVSLAVLMLSAWAYLRRRAR